jgi:DNA mismatch repair protein MutL
MESKIRVLDEQTINKIAAGEVIENPSSVVKELVENSLDAQATEITIEIKGGGRQLIRVVDNGFGMCRDDAILCFERHATSKIRQLDDISYLGTMGFRGEAIPSIAAISKFTLITSPAVASGDGTMIVVEGGRMVHSSSVVRSAGTTMEVKSLFFNVPVRRKFQKSVSFDVAAIHKVVNLQSLGNPQVSFRLISDQQTLLMASPWKSESFQDMLGGRISDVMGSEFLAATCQLFEKEGDWKMTGFIGVPSYTRHNRSGQHLFINQRHVFVPAISSWVSDGYGTRLSSNRYPVFVLHLDIPGELVDVNVHPQKREIRLKESATFREFILRAVDKSLQRTIVCEPQRHSVVTPTFALQREEEGFLLGLKDMEPRVKPQIAPPAMFEEDVVGRKVKVIGTIKGYIVVDGSTLHLDKAQEEGLVFVDQHQAHARIIFERMIGGAKTAESQSLLMAVTLDFGAADGRLLEENLDIINKMGIGLRHLGGNTFMVDALPAMIKNIDISNLIWHVIEELQQCQGKGFLEKEREKKLALVASRLAVYDNRRLTVEQGQLMVEELLRTGSPYYSPGGQAIMISWTSVDMEHQFHKRTINVV